MPSNSNLGVRIYTPKYKKMLDTVFTVKHAFGRAMAPIQILDGVNQNAKAFSVKTCGTPVVIGEYDTTATVQFSTGTGTGSRFGDMTEVIYADADVNYDYTMAIHEGLDRFTVNNGLDAAVADRLKLQSEAQVRHMNKKNGKFISTNAGHSLQYSAGKILELFSAAAKYYTDKEVTAPVSAYVNPDLYNAIIDSGLVTSAKGSSVNIDKNIINDFKGFRVESTPTTYFNSTDVAYFVPDGVIIPFVGIQTARTIEAEDFDGVKLQAAAKGGTYVLDDNKPAIVKVTPGA